MPDKLTDPVAARFDLALAAAEAGAALAMDHFLNRGRLVIEAKATPQDIVSRADREVEDLIRAHIGAAFPDDGILGEEGGGQAGTTGFTWVIDPIDGTSPFLAGLPHWCVVVALVDGETTVAGVIAQPTAAEIFTARRGHGVTLGGVAMRCDPAHRIENSLVAIGASHRTDPGHVAGVIAELMNVGGIYYRNGSGALMLAHVAAGRLGGYYEPHMNPWDCLAGLLMVEEAGGQTLPLGPDPRGGVVMAAAPGVWDGLLSVVEAAPPDRARRATGPSPR